VIGVSLFAALGFIWVRFRPARVRALVAALTSLEPTPGMMYACAAGLVCAFLAQVYILVFQVWHENTPGWLWSQQLPIPVYNGQTGLIAYHRICSYAALAVALLQTGFLGYLALAVQRRVPRAVAVSGAVVALLAIVALATPAMSTTDPYEYAAASMIGWSAYAPPPGIFDGTAYAPIFPHIKLEGVLYGPLWLVFDIFELGHVPSILGKLVVLRIVNAGLLFLFAGLLARLRLSRAAIVAWLANPAVWYYSVVSPHADIEGLVLIAGAALAVAARRPWFALALVGIAGCFKLPYVVMGGAVFAGLRTAWQRLGFWCGAIAVTLAVTLALAGTRYMLGFGSYVSHSGTFTRESAAGFWVVFAMLAVAATTSFVTTGRGIPAAAWMFGQLGPLAAPWYLQWGIPFAMGTGALTLFALSLPLGMVVSETAFNLWPLPSVLVVGCGIALIADDLRSRRRTGRELEGGAPAG
jgi:hypothetical protein